MTDILLVAYHYPPIVSGGTQRAVSLVRNLPANGFHAHVLTTNTFGADRAYPAYRSSELVGLYRSLRNPGSDALPPSLRSRTRTGGGRSLPVRAARALMVPDGQVGWLPSAYRTARHILNTHPVNAVLTTGPPFSSHLLGLALHHSANIPWVADFRDLWTYDPLDDQLQSTAFRRALDRWLERAVCRTATHVTCASDVAAGHLSAVGSRRVTLIPNGYEADEIPSASARSGSEPYLFVHSGSFSDSHPMRSPKVLVDAALKVRDDVHFQIVFVGSLSAGETELIRPLVEAGRARLIGPVDRTGSLEWQAKADALIVVDHPRDVLASNIPGKVYEYGATGKPILAVVPAGATDSLIRDLKGGVCVRHDAGRVANAITALVDGTAIASPDAARWEPYERSHSVTKMAEVLRSVTGADGR